MASGPTASGVIARLPSDDEHGCLRHQRQGGTQELGERLRGVFKGIVRAAQQWGEVERVVPPDWFT